MSTTHAKAAKAFLSDKVNAEWHDKTLYMVRAKRDRLSHAIPEWEELRHTARDLKLYSNSHLPELNGTDLVICRGIFGVCENAAVYFEQEYLQRSIYFISESLLILLPKDQLVDTMHDAYRRIPNEPPGEFRGFISGPSKTADIEQALVMGAHGSRQTTVLLV